MVKSACNAGDSGLIPGSGKSPEGGNANPLQYSCLENPMDRGTWWDTVPGVTKSQTCHKESNTTERLSLHSRMPRYHCASSRLALVCCSSNRGDFHDTKDVTFFLKP